MIAPRVTLTRPAAHPKPAPAYAKAKLVAPQPAPAAQKRASVDEKTRETMIREAAYLYAERRGFMPGQELEDWLAAEREIDQLLALRATEQW